MEIVLGERLSSHLAGITAKLEEEEGVTEIGVGPSTLSSTATTVLLDSLSMVHWDEHEVD